MDRGWLVIGHGGGHGAPRAGRYFGDHLKAGVGYNFTNFSDDLTDLGYNHQGAFMNVVGTW